MLRVYLSPLTLFMYGWKACPGLYRADRPHRAAHSKTVCSIPLDVLRLCLLDFQSQATRICKETAGPDGHEHAPPPTPKDIHHHLAVTRVGGGVVISTRRG